MVIIRKIDNKPETGHNYIRISQRHDVTFLTLGLPSYFLRNRLPRGVVTTTPRFSVWFKILHRLIQRLIRHYFLSKMVYLNIKYVIVTRNYDLLYYRCNRPEYTPGRNIPGYIIS